MKKITSVLFLLIFSLAGFSQSLSSLPSKLGTYTAFKDNPLSITINMPVGYTIPTPVVSEIWVSGLKTSFAPTTTVSGQVVTITMPAAQVTRLPAISDLYIKFNSTYLLGATIKPSVTSGTPSTTPYTVTLPSGGSVSINLIGDAAAAAQYAARAKVLKDSVTQNQWTGKIGCFTGTSIVHQFQETGNDYPTLMGKLLGCSKIWNMGISGSTLIFKAPSGTDMGSAGMSGTYSQLIAAGFAQNYSYENRIIGMLYPPFNCSFVVIDHLTNDLRYLDDSLGTLDSRDIGTFMGALNNTIDKIHEVKPLVKIILVVTPNLWAYGGEGAAAANKDRFHIGAKAIQDIGDYRGIPVIRLDKKMGITGKNVGSKTTDGLHINQATSIEAATVLYREMLLIN